MTTNLDAKESPWWRRTARRLRQPREQRLDYPDAHREHRKPAIDPAALGHPPDWYGHQ